MVIWSFKRIIILFQNKTKMSWKILVIWDIMIDKYTFWQVKRLNPEAPVPLINVNKEEYRLWWAANVAANISSLNEKVDLIWLVGQDDNAKLMEKLCKEKNINLYAIKIKNFKTILKQRVVETTYNQQLLRIDYENYTRITEDELRRLAEDGNKDLSEDVFRRLSEEIVDFVKNWNYSVIVISDYNKWLINKNLIEKIKKISKQKNIKLLADAKPKNYEFFKDFYLIKPNFKEFCQMIWKEIENEDSQIEKHWTEFVKKMNTNLVITRWAKWASLITKDWKYYHLPTEAKKVFDVTWAWDTFIATLAYALNQWYKLVDAVKLANKASWIVVWKVGTVVIEKDELFK